MASLLQQNAALRSSNTSMDAYVAKCNARVAALVSQARAYLYTEPEPKP